MNKRTELIETKGIFPPIIIFPEGTTSNGKVLSKFRRGAFTDLRQVMPVSMKYKFGMVHPAVESIDEPFIVFLMACAVQVLELEMILLPPFAPNEYLFETHRDKGEEKWEVYAWATRDLLAKVGGFGKYDISFKEKIKVYDFYMGKIDKLEFENGERVEYREDGDYEDKGW